jgi:ribonucleotide monophosphatase NagD (HAD superfamily)
LNFLEKYDYFIFDLDGTIYRGEHLIPRADEVINHLKAKKIVFVSNKQLELQKIIIIF